MTTDRVGRLAPTPSGDLHLGNTVAFAACWLSARQGGGRVLLRVEDVDRSRARRHIEDEQKRDLEWLGLTWDTEVPPQRDRDYPRWLGSLPDTYVCACTRRTIQEGGGNHPLGCRTRGSVNGAVRYALPDRWVRFNDRVHGPREVRPLEFGDPVLRRRDGVFTYNLAVVADDIADGVTEVVRGSDLLDYTAVQIELWKAFGATPPTWLHAPLVRGPDGRKLSKSHGALGISALRDAGVSVRAIHALVLGWLGIEGDDLASAVPSFDPSKVTREPIDLPEDWRQPLGLR
ncbi:MAG: glutamate--tRNA ligase family protein [Myxococcota bacterium]